MTLVSPAEVSAPEVALLRGGWPRGFECAVAQLVATGHLAVHAAMSDHRMVTELQLAGCVVALDPAIAPALDLVREVVGDRRSVPSGEVGRRAREAFPGRRYEDEVVRPLLVERGLAGLRPSRLRRRPRLVPTDAGRDVVLTLDDRRQALKARADAEAAIELGWALLLDGNRRWTWVTRLAPDRRTRFSGFHPSGIAFVGTDHGIGVPRTAEALDEAVSKASP